VTVTVHVHTYIGLFRVPNVQCNVGSYEQDGP